jgi:hypothetical protein
VDRSAGGSVLEVEVDERPSLQVGEVALSHRSAQAEAIRDLCRADRPGRDGLASRSTPAALAAPSAHDQRAPESDP